jgi:hypothetical protein
MPSESELTTTPFYATNCYVAALGEPITYTLTLYNGTDAARLPARHSDRVDTRVRLNRTRTFSPD